MSASKASTIKGSVQGGNYQAQKASYSNSYNFSAPDLTIEEQWKEMREVAKLNHSVEKPTLAAVLSPMRENTKNFTADDWKKLAEEYAKEMNFFENQWRFDVHKDTKNPHIHFWVNRVNFNGECTIKAHRVGERSGKIAEKIDKRRGWKTAKEIGNEKKIKAKDAIYKTMQQATSLEEFKTLMKQRGYITEISENARGINGARIIPTAEYTTPAEQSKRQQMAKQGFKLSDISKVRATGEHRANKLQIGGILQQIEKNNAKAIKQRQEQDKPKRRGLRI